MTDQNLPQTSGSVGLDALGIGSVAKHVVGPIVRGVGRILEPVLGRLDNAAQIANFNAWDEAIRLKGYTAQSVNLSLGERAEVTMLATAIERQNNRENVAAHTIEQAKLHFDPGTTLDVPPIDNAWLDHFWRLAENVGENDMQAFWGLILARKCTSASPVSMRALDFLSTLSADEARSIERIAGFVIRLELAPGQWNWGILNTVNDPAFTTEDYKLRRDRLRQSIGDYRRSLFASLGIFLESGFAHDFAQELFPGRSNGIEFWIANQKFAVRGDVPLDKGSSYYSIGSGTGISPLGQEIFAMVSAAPSADYVAALKDGFSHRGWVLVED